MHRTSFVTFLKSVNQRNVPSPSSNGPTTTTTGPAHWLTKLVVDYHNFLYYLVLTPFKIKFDPQSAQFSVQPRTSCIKFIVLLHHLIAIGQASCLFLYNPDFRGGDDFTKKVKWTSTTIWIMCLVAFIWRFWRDQNQFTQFLNQLQNIGNSLDGLGVQKPSRWAISGISMTLILGTLLWGGLDTVDSMYRYIGIFSEQPLQFGPTTIRQTHLNDSMAPFDDNDKNIFLTGLLRTLGIAFLFWTSSFMIRLTISLSLVFVLSLYMSVQVFTSHLKKFTRQNTSSSPPPLQGLLGPVLQVFDQLCVVSETMGQNVGGIILSACFGLCPYYAFKVLIILQSDWLDILIFISYSITFGASLIFGAETVSKIGQLVDWLQHRRRYGEEAQYFQDISAQLQLQRRLTIVLSQIERHGVGVKGKIFTITYGLVGSISGLIVTYAMICFQLRSASMTTTTISPPKIQ